MQVPDAVEHNEDTTSNKELHMKTTEEIHAECEEYVKNVDDTTLYRWASAHIDLSERMPKANILFCLIRSSSTMVADANGDFADEYLVRSVREIVDSHRSEWEVDAAAYAVSELQRVTQNKHIVDDELLESCLHDGFSYNFARQYIQCDSIHVSDLPRMLICKMYDMCVLDDDGFLRLNDAKYLVKRDGELVSITVVPECCEHYFAIRRK